MTWFEQGDTRIYYEETGAGDPVLVVPGWGGTIDELAGVRDALAAQFRVIAADPPGSGKSGPQPRTYPPSYYQDDARALLALLDSVGASPAHLVGFSDGGEYSLLMAAMEPRAVRSVATWGAAGSLGTNAAMADAFATVVDEPIPPMAGFSDYLKATYGEANARVMTQSTAKVFRSIMEAGGDISRSRAASITCPALLMTGSEDFLATPDLVFDMANAIRLGEYMEANGAGHALHHEQPEWLIKLVVGWVDGQ